MALSEEQIVRFSRQILLPDVGGRGQERLLAAEVELRGSGAAQDVAKLYLTRGGTPVGEASSAPGEIGQLGELPATFGGKGPWVALGWRGGWGAVVYRTEMGCAACFNNTLEKYSPADASRAAVLVGTLAALVYQRIALGLSDSLGALEADERGQVRPAAVLPCEAHR